MKWVGIAATRPLRFGRKPDNPQPNHYTARKVDFGISGWSWCAFSFGGKTVLMPSGQDAQIHEARLNRSGHVVGLRDLTTCDHTGNPVLIEEWRGSLADRISYEMSFRDPVSVRKPSSAPGLGESMKQFDIRGPLQHGYA
jgi:hypothetical protein